MENVSFDYLRQKTVKKLKKIANQLLDKPKAVGAVSLSLENAQAIYGSRPDVTVHSYYKKGIRPDVKPQHLPDEGLFSFQDFTFPVEPTHYEAVVLDIVNPAFSFQHSHLIDDANRVIYEAKVSFTELAIQHEYLQNPPRIAGTVAYLSNTVLNHYGHWIQLQLPLLLSYWDLFGKENIDYYYIGDCSIPDFLIEMFEQMGIRRDQIMNHPCRADRSLISMKYRDIDKENDIRNGIDMDEHSYHFLKNTLAESYPKTTGSTFAEKIFVLRGNVSSRRELNMSEIKAALEPHGFVFMAMDGNTIREQAAIFGNARVIAGVHGSGLHNILFARPGTKIIEIFPHDYPEVSNYSMAAHGQCAYYYMIGEPLGQDSENLSFMDRNKADIRINPDKLLRLCQQANVLSESVIEQRSAGVSQ